MSPVINMPPLLAALATGKSVFLQVDAKALGCTVPAEYCKESVIVLQIGYNLIVPIPDLRISPLAITATLSFNRRPIHCVIPWGALLHWQVEVDSIIAPLPTQTQPKPKRQLLTGWSVIKGGKA